MPGRVSGLDRHEWIRHGRCYGLEPEAYFRIALGLLDQLNRSPVRTVFVEHIDAPLSIAAVRAAFERSFGAGAGQAVSLRCTAVAQRRLVSELRIRLTAPVTDSSPLATVLDRSGSDQGDCEVGFVDRVGSEGTLRP